MQTKLANAETGDIIYTSPEGESTIRGLLAGWARFMHIDEVFTQPYCRIDNLVQAGVARRQTASRYLKLLAEMGVLEERKIGREKLFVHLELLNLLADEGTSR